ncbi:hypothetical protein IQ03_01230 [Gemmobacter caeni]|uniref:Phage integrase family protein n=1 Tax=Gemmobacter caeni TaxID=589035 RepID=A0A2T6B8W7_9RHOB|nr:site-specific integrase [Gemmobacter caeni]PTX52517.1 hypothetical protein C8N34_102297 [Gemmobacter caeni]TWJ02812.1 hypothetical protein IQ03_01230 [Gemmobacter caeni]
MNDITPDPVNPAYIGDFNRILKSMSARLKIQGTRPSSSEIGNQIAIRTVLLNVSSARREVTAIRAICRRFVEEGVWPEGVFEQPPITEVSREDIARLLEFVTLPVSELIEMGTWLISDITARLTQTGYPGSQEDLAQSLSGVYPNRSREASPDRQKHVPITESDLSRIDFPMMDQPHEDGVSSLATGRANVLALTRIFLRVVWLTGMRPTEVFDCVLMCGDPKREYTHAQIGLIRTNPEKAAMSGLLIPQEALDGAELIGHVRAVIDARTATRIDPVLMIRNAKTRNGNPNLVRAFRAQVLTGVPDEDLRLISLAARLHGIPLTEARKRDLISMITKHVRTTAERELADRTVQINLYALRHDFATRARRVMPMHKVAALMGHTSRGSTQGYGKTRTRQSRSGSGSGGWVPGCDETVARRLQAAFGTDTTRSAPEQGPEETAPAPE